MQPNPSFCKPERVVSMFLHSDDGDASGVQVSITFRCPAELTDFIDAMAAEAVVTRTQMLVQLLRVGVDAVYSQLPNNIQRDIEAGYIDRTAARELAASEE